MGKDKVSIEIITVACSAIFLVAFIMIVSCGKPPSPGPGPDPLTDFTVTGKTVSIVGKLKAGASVSVGEATRALKTAADLIDAK